MILLTLKTRSYCVPLLVMSLLTTGCMYRRAADLDHGITPSIPCHRESCGPGCGTTVHVDHIPAPIPELPDPRTLTHKQDLPMSLRHALVTGIDRSRVARTQFGPQGAVVSGTIYQQQIADALRYAELGIFDTVVGGNLLFPNEKNPPGTSFNGFAVRPTELHRGDFDLYATQKMRRGGSFTLSHIVDYLYVPGGAAAINPQWQSALEAAYTQPLLRGHGEFVTAAPVAIKATQANQSVWEFKRQLLQMAREIEVAYWEYQSADERVRLIDGTLPVLEDIVKKLEARVEAERGTQGQVARAKSTYYTLKDQRIEAQRVASEKEFLLRNLIGLPPTDGYRILPTDKPLLAPVVYDWNELLQVAMHKRPEVIRQRLAVHVANLQWKVAENNVLPQLDTYVAVRSNGLNDDLGDSWRMMFAGEYISVNAGLVFEAPWQRTRERGNLRAASLKVSQERELLNQLGHQISHELASVVRDLDAILNEYVVAEQRIEAADEWTRAARAAFTNPGQETNYSQTFDRLLRAVQARLNAGNRYIDVLRNYNIALVVLDERRGTLLEGHSFVVEGDQTEEANQQLAPQDAQEDEDIERLPKPAPEVDNPNNSEARTWPHGHNEPQFAEQANPAVPLASSDRQANSDSSLQVQGDPQQPVVVGQWTLDINPSLANTIAEAQEGAPAEPTAQPQGAQKPKASSRKPSDDARSSAAVEAAKGTDWNRFEAPSRELSNKREPTPAPRNPASAKPSSARQQPPPTAPARTQSQPTSSVRDSSGTRKANNLQAQTSNPPVRVDVSQLKRDVAPPQPANPPVRVDASQLKRNVTHRKRPAAPAQAANPPVRVDTSQVKSNVAPAQAANPPVRVDTSQAKRNVAPAQAAKRVPMNVSQRTADTRQASWPSSRVHSTPQKTAGQATTMPPVNVAPLTEDFQNTSTEAPGQSRYVAPNVMPHVAPVATDWLQSSVSR